MRGVVITGRLGVGKSTTLAELVNSYGFTTPVTTTTRPVSNTDVGLLHAAKSEFIAAVRDGNLLMPMISAGQYYAWTSSEFSLLSAGNRIAISVRPYTALALAATFSGLRPVWLDVSDDVRRLRLAGRREERDIDTDASAAREIFDQEDAEYRPFFESVLDATNSAAQLIHGMFHGR